MMKKIVLSLIIAVVSYASPAYVGKITFEQNDGSKFTAWEKGDEWFSWIEDAKGRVIVYNKKSKNYEFAIYNDTEKSLELQPSGISVTSKLNVNSTSLDKKIVYKLWRKNREEVYKVLKEAME